MIKSLPKARIYTSVAVVVVLMIITGALLFWLNKERASISNNVDTYAMENTAIADMVKKARLAREESEMVTAIATMFRTATDTVAVIEEIESIATQSGVSLEITKADRERSDNGEEQLVLSIDASGTWQNAYRFVAELDGFVYVHTTTRVALVKSYSADGAAEMWTASIEMSIPLIK